MNNNLHLITAFPVFFIHLHGVENREYNIYLRGTFEPSKSNYYEEVLGEAVIDKNEHHSANLILAII